MKEKITKGLPLILLIAFCIQAIGGMWNSSATYDEVAHLPAGYSYIKKGDFRFNPEHPPLIKIIAAFPLLFLKIPPLEENPYWHSNNEWQFGRYFLYRSGIDADRALFLGRIIMVFLALLLGYLIFAWSRELYGRSAGLFSLFLFTFEPNILAHSQIIHTDLGFSLFMTSSLYFFWKAMEFPTRIRFIAAGLNLGLALATKFTSLLLFPIYLSLLLLYLLEKNGTIAFKKFLFQQEDDLSLRLRLYFILFTFPLLLLTSFLILVLCYGFFAFGRYIDGLAFVLNHHQKGNPSFLLGQYSDFGWWSYFPIAFLIKTPLPLLIIFFLAIFFLMKERFASLKKKETYQEKASRRFPSIKFNLYRELYLLLPGCLFMFLSLFSHINIGLRHILPIYPLLIIFSGRFFFHVMTFPYHYYYARGWRTLTFALMFWMAASGLFIFPHHLAYFNELIGGPSHGYKYLVDSNLDWGQDLIRLKKFLDQEGEHSVILSYLGSADPNYYGMKYQYLPGYGLNHPQEYEITFQRKEFLAISATNLQSVFFNFHDTYNWIKEKKPYARIGYSIFVWDISKDLLAHQNLARLYSDFGLDDLAAKHLREAHHLLLLQYQPGSSSKRPFL